MRKYQWGFSAVEVLVAIALSSGVVLGTSKLITDSAKSGAQSERQFWLEARRLQLQNIIKSTSGWNDIIASNSGLACLESNTGCSSYTTPQALRISIDGKTLDGSSASLGMASTGDFCNAFDASNGNAYCLVGLSLKWQIECDDSLCKHGIPKVSVRFQMKESASAGLQKLSSYDLVVYKDPKVETLSEVCISMGGTLNGINCTLPQLSSACSPSTGSFVLGFDNMGSVICGKPNPGTCGGTDVAMGFDANGGLQCATACP